MTKPAPIEPVELHPIDMHGPIEVYASIYARLPSGGIGKMEMRMEAGKIPSAATIKDSMDNVLVDNTGAGIPEGTRLLTKPEFVEHITKRETGTAIPLPGDQHYVAPETEIPVGILVHAIVGAGLPAEFGDEFKERGLAYVSLMDDDGRYLWNTARLEEQPADVLLAIYERITA